MLKRLIAHEIIKEQHATTAKLGVLRSKLLPIDNDLSAVLVADLQDSFQQQNPIVGVFKSADTTMASFQQSLLGYLGSPDDKAFVALTKNAMLLLKDEMAGEPLATGGYVVFAEYEESDAKFLLTALLSTTAKPSFDKDLNLVPSMALDLEHLRHGARVRLDAVSENAEGVVQFISRRAYEVSGYFVDFIGCEEITRPDVQGRRLQTKLSEWAVAKELSVPAKQELMGEAYNYVEKRRKKGKDVTLTELARVLSPGDHKPLLRHLGGGSQPLAGKFAPPSPSVMRPFFRFSFNAEGLRLEFDRKIWQNRVAVDDKRRILTIRNVPAALIAAIKGM